MSIAPPSDIVLDVARAADPVKLQAATARLQKLAAGGDAAPEDFANHVGTAFPAGNVAPPPAEPPPAVFRSEPASPYQKFEAVLLQTMVQDILPKDPALFGDEASADACRSLMAEQIALQIAKTGKIGIAKLVESSQRLPSAGPRLPPAEPLGPATSTGADPTRRAS